MNYAFKDYSILQKDSVTFTSFLAGNGHSFMAKWDLLQ